jgi:ABC-type multidrug transport system fused ATPase/permease subunit
MLRQALPFVERVQRARQRYLASMSGNGKRPLRRVRTMLFENVSFHYRPGVPVLSDISFEISDGEAVGIVGPTGAGKSTLVQILLRLRTPRIGRYLINGSPASEFNANDWHARIAYLPQEPRLMHASVADNIRFFRKLDDRDVEHAAMVAGIHERISSWTDGYATIIGPRADAVSGGEQQRICLARALAARPEVLILDEPTSALDPHTERLIQESFVNLKERLTLIVIAHRMSTIDICERVMVIVDGRLQGFDDAETLRTSSAYFRSASELAASGSLVEPTPPHHTHAGRRTVK